MIAFRWLILTLSLSQCVSTARGQLDEPFPGLPGGKQRPSRVDNVRFTVAPQEARRGDTVEVKLSLSLQSGYYTYAVTQPDKEVQAFASRLDLVLPEGLKVVGFIEPEGRAEEKKGLGTLRLLDGDVNWTWSVAIAEDSQPGPKKIGLKALLQICDENTCLPLDDSRETVVTVSAAPAAPPVSPSGPAAANEGSPAPPTELAKAGDDFDLWLFLLKGVVAGLVTLLTPCVFPMIPITVSYFIKQSEREHHRPVAMALVYSLTIVVVLTISAVALLAFFQRLSQHWATNTLLGLLFVLFALSLFGMFELRLPTSLANFTSAKEGQGGMLGVTFMALTFTIISFTCVAPFLGAFAGAVARERPLWQTVLGGLAFSATFASPFFLLALFPSLLRAMPKSGNWMNNVKVVMGFLEIAAALKFFRAAELFAMAERGQDPRFFTYDFCMAAYVILALLCGVYLLGLFRLDHDAPSEHLGSSRLMFAFLFLALGAYLTPALWNHAPRGTVFAWVDAFLLPDSNPVPKQPPGFGDTPRQFLPAFTPNPEVEAGLPWIPNLEEGLKAAREKKRRVFLDFTGVTCTNCALNERTVFTRPEVRELLNQYVLVQLYVDVIPPKYAGRSDKDKNLELQGEVFGDFQLPLYVVIEPSDGKQGFKEIARYAEGKINDVPGFKKFLSDNAAWGKNGAQAKAE